ncbi:hypothetical protein B0H17DRAFT_1216214 [Mycena rosella]|uniref:Uncharacterized protein n=1 Tax=Mycena rosella TaxID=1033263 RepID=A0AAD7CAF0_MYCRO|nr:hypothetical protein B0H17DRAFT_1216214 [Mycena rosella]
MRALSVSGSISAPPTKFQVAARPVPVTARGADGINAASPGRRLRAPPTRLAYNAHGVDFSPTRPSLICQLRASPACHAHDGHPIHGLPFGFANYLRERSRGRNRRVSGAPPTTRLRFPALEQGTSSRTSTWHCRRLFWCYTTARLHPHTLVQSSGMPWPAPQPLAAPPDIRPRSLEPG